MRAVVVAVAIVLVAGCAGTPPSTTRPSLPPAATTTPGSLVTPVATLGTRLSPAAPSAAPPSAEIELVEYRVTPGAHPHDVAPADDGGMWFTGQANGTMGHLDPSSGDVREIPLGAGSAPHGVIAGSDGAAWVTDSGLNAIVRVDAETDRVEVFPLPGDRPNANLNTATFDPDGVLWFTGQSGIYGRLDPDNPTVEVFDAPGGRGPYGIATTPQGDVWYASLAGSHIARIDRATRRATALEPPTTDAGPRRIWSDSGGRLWISEWNAGQVGMYDPATDDWREWPLPGEDPQAYAVYVDARDVVWLTDFGTNAIVRFDPASESFRSFPLPTTDAAVRQLLGRGGEVWGAESGADKLVVIRTP